MAHISAVAGFNAPLTADFVDSAGEPVAPTGFPTLTIRNADKVPIHEEVLEAEHETGVVDGQYLVNYLVPTWIMNQADDSTTLTAEFVGVVAGITAIGARHTIAVTWT